MATIIIQGTKEENLKAFNALKENFATVNKKGATVADTGTMTVYDIYLEADNGREYSDKEIDLGLRCCSNVERDCASCPFKKETKCIETMQTEASLYVQRLVRAQTKKDSSEEGK